MKIVILIVIHVITLVFSLESFATPKALSYETPVKLEKVSMRALVPMTFIELHRRLLLDQRMIAKSSETKDKFRSWQEDLREKLQGSSGKFRL